jgi:hypothetical protein
MKRCPSCQQVFPDQSPDQCPYDGTQLVGDGQQQYYAGNQPYAGGQPYGGNQPPYGAPGDPSQWQPPGAGYAPPGGQYPPPAYGGPYAPARGSGALSTAGFICGLGAFIILVFVIFVYVMARNGSLSLSTLLTLAQILQPLSWLMLLAAVASIVLGIISLVSSSRNPAISKPKAIVGMCLGAIPLLLFLIGIANTSAR